MRLMEVAAGLEPAKTGFADRRLDHFGIATLKFVPRLYPKVAPERPLWPSSPGDRGLEENQVQLKQRVAAN